MSQCDFSFTQGTSLTLLQELKAGKVDLAICSYIADEPDIDFIPVIQQELVVVTAKDHPLARLYEHEVDLVETIHYPYIYFSENSGLRPFIDNVFMQQKLVPEIACYVDEDTAMAGLVSIDYGIAIMPRITALSYYNVHILKIKNTIPRYIYLATMKDKGLSPALESLKMWLSTIARRSVNGWPGCDLRAIRISGENIHHFTQLSDGDLPRRGGLTNGTEGHRRTEQAPGDPANATGFAHRHGDQRTRRILLFHGQRGGEQGEYVLRRLRHHRDLRQIGPRSCMRRRR